MTEPLHRYLLRRTTPDTVEDILSETMLVLWRRVEDVPGLGTGHCLADARRSDGRRLPLVERLIGAQRESGALAADHSELHAALGALSELDREVVRLWAWEEMTSDERRAGGGEEQHGPDAVPGGGSGRACGLTCAPGH
ncbi:RNA polymerase sigma factor [Streptomyces cylindrosporus]|uniref:Uncharacterized protein n=1 Tax=Streptomyces cylindrosporus TaxID=2927583 RepID=A0ABS9YIF3_9ACTN|nr:hypothetical protein [Streptomyces cylindrosporus]MCI3276954.1 hypothetical protein [Streptomyces cylindrosporus]